LCVFRAPLHNETAKWSFFRFCAKEFDVKRAYNEIKMFREMATAAKCRRNNFIRRKVAGNQNEMLPIYPSLAGILV
jgi:AsmA protein